jgi:Family of unknown function (DUF6286)
MWAVNRIATGLLGLVLLAGGLLVALEVALVAGGLDPLLPLDAWRRELTTTPLSDRRVLVTSVVVGVLGLLVLVAQLRPWPPRRVLIGEPDGTEWWVFRRSVERSIEAAANAVTGVAGARAAVRGPERRWRLRMSAQASPERLDAIQRAIRAELQRLSAPEDVPVGVRLRAPRRVA